MHSRNCKDLAAAVTAIFNQLLQKLKGAHIELDRVQRTSGLRNLDFSFLYDTFGRVHKVKEEIMHVSSTQDSILLNETPVMLLPDSPNTGKRQALKPIMQLL